MNNLEVVADTGVIGTAGSTEILNNLPESFDRTVVAALINLSQGGSQNLLTQLAEVFLATAPQQIRKIRDALRVNDHVTVSYEAHTLGGICANLGARSLYRHCMDVEFVIEGGGHDQCAALIHTIENELPRTLSVVSTWTTAP
jgi:HPt (histidine-containing phosphotransfer) domain-containing protein